MATKKLTQSGIEYETGSGNIFADLGLPNAEEKHTRAMLAVQIFQILEKRNVKKQKDVAELLGIDKSEASKLMNAEFTRFSRAVNRIFKQTGLQSHHANFPHAKRGSTARSCIDVRLRAAATICSKHLNRIKLRWTGRQEYRRNRKTKYGF